MLTTFIIALIACGWICALFSPRWYLRALCATAPWQGLYLIMVWNLDAFKIGLLLSPILFLVIRRSAPTGKLLLPLLLLAAYALCLVGWQVMTKEVAAFDQLGHLSLSSRITTANGIFLCKLLVIVLICKVVKSREEARTCINSYVTSVSVLALYGLVQEAAFLATGDPITPIYTAGLFGEHQQTVTADVFGFTFLRVYSFSMEPKDLAFFLVPAIAFVSASLSVARSERRRHNWLRWTQLAIMSAAALLTFSTSLLVILPLTMLAIELIRPTSRLMKRGRRN